MPVGALEDIRSFHLIRQDFSIAGPCPFQAAYSTWSSLLSCWLWGHSPQPSPSNPWQTISQSLFDYGLPLKVMRAEPSSYSSVLSRTRCCPLLADEDAVGMASSCESYYREWSQRINVLDLAIR